MLLWVMSYVGGVLTILSPCILPVVPFVFARSDRSFFRGPFPVLMGLVCMFAIVSALTAYGGAWVIRANQWGRWFSLILFAVFGLSLIIPHYFEKLMQPLVRVGGKLSSSFGGGDGFFSSFIMGIATGLLWAPCAGPILGLILSEAATQENSFKVSALLFAYGLGAATSLLLVLLLGGAALTVLKRYLRIERIVKATLGVVLLLDVAAIALGYDKDVLVRVSKISTERTEAAVQRYFNGEENRRGVAVEDSFGSNEEEMPEISGAIAWLNSPPLSKRDLAGKLVLIDFWTYSCINCLRTLPYVRAWAEKYRDAGLVVIGVHSPEFAFEKDPGNVAKAVNELGIKYPVAVDSNHLIWEAFGNRYWPAHYLVDGKGVIRNQQFGEGNYRETEEAIRNLLAERMNVSAIGLSQVDGKNAEAPGSFSNMRSPETYLGYERAINFVLSPGLKSEAVENYTISSGLRLNQWSLGGAWLVGREDAVLHSSRGEIVFRFHARDLHLVMGPSVKGKVIRYRVLINGKAPAENHGSDVNEEGYGVVREPRLYQLIRQKVDSRERNGLKDQMFRIEFLDPGIQAYSFTFG